MLSDKDLEASTKFYTEVLGFEISLRRPTATFSTCGMIHHDPALFQAPESALPATEGQGGGLGHNEGHLTEPKTPRRQAGP